MELAARKLDAADEHGLADDAALVRQQVDRCRDILEHLRGDVAGRGTDEPGRCDPRAAVARLRAGLRPDRAWRFDTVLRGPLPCCCAPPRATERALGLLVNNAFDASPPTGRVTLTADDGGGAVRFAVADAGAGMDPDTLRRATEPFFTTKDPGRGMGLGLFLVRLVAERNGGELSLESSAGHGTTATLALPAAGG